MAYIGDDTSYLLYAGRWFPVNAYGINRFTATMSITVPAHMVVIGSGKETAGSPALAKKPTTGALPTKTYTFTWDKPSFPGTIVAGTFQEFKSDEAGLDLHVFFKPAHQNLGATYATTAVKEFTYYVTLYGAAPSTTLKVVELPDDTVPAAWAPELPPSPAAPSLRRSTTACWPIPSRTSGGAFRSAQLRGMIGG